MSEALRKIPSVDALLRSDAGKRAADRLGRPVLKAAVQRALEEARTDAADGGSLPSGSALLGRAVSIAARTSHGVTTVINATGVVLHTGLGRAPLSDEAARAAASAARGYTDLEVDRESGGRGRRSARAEATLVAVTGAEDALVVNNNAAALMLALAALARRKEVLVSRGELIEIGGEFRLPDIMAASGAKLVEVGTTNRTRLGDYKDAITEKTALILKVHPSNYRVVGFQGSPPVQELAKTASKAGVPLLFDVGSGLIDRYPGVPADEPSVTEALAQGADLVCFSGDKLLGGPQAGIVVGGAAYVEKLRTDPMARAVRVDKMQIAALEAVLLAYSRGVQFELPVWRMLQEPAAAVKERANALARALGGGLEDASVEGCLSAVGGGSLPGFELPSFAVRLKTPNPNTFVSNLREGSPPVFCRVEDDSLLFDMRTVDPAEVAVLARVISYAMESDDGRDED